jgi:uncharacterized protein (DUF2336 family)
VIIQTFLRWADTAKSSERAKAASALARAWLQSEMISDERDAALMALTWLLDDPSPKVRLALAEAIASSPVAPRSLILPLAADQPEIACHIISQSPVLSDVDLVDLAGRGDQVTRILIASRFIVSMPVSAAIAEIGDQPEIEALLDNPGAVIATLSLRRIAERLSGSAEIRERLLTREELPADARQRIAASVSEAIAASDFVTGVIGMRKLDRIRREAGDAAAVILAGAATGRDLPDLVELLRADGRLTPGFLMQALCGGKVDFFAACIHCLTALGEKRIRSIMSDGRFHAMRALYESAGLTRDISEIFVEATVLWRQASGEGGYRSPGNIADRLVGKFRAHARADSAAGELIDMVEKLQIAERRQSARAYASFLAIEAA